MIYSFCAFKKFTIKGNDKINAILAKKGRGAGDKMAKNMR
jgi:hypothetical protein